MMRLFLVDRSDGRRVDLGLFKFNDVANCIVAASRRHRFLSKLETNNFEFVGQFEPGPLRRGRAPEALVGEQLTIEGAL